MVEAVIELRIPRLDAKAEVFAAFREVLDTFRESHPDLGEVEQFQASGSFTVGALNAASSAAVEQFRFGFARWSSESRIQLSLDGILVSTTQKPYIGGARLIELAQGASRAFREAFAGIGYSRIGWRTINRIDLPGASIPDAGRLIHSWRAMQTAGFELVLPIAHLQGVKAAAFPGLVGRVTTVLQADPSPETLSLVVDVDGASEGSDEDFETVLASLREWKNHAFFTTLDEEARTWLR